MLFRSVFKFLSMSFFIINFIFSFVVVREHDLYHIISFILVKTSFIAYYVVSTYLGSP